MVNEHVKETHIQIKNATVRCILWSPLGDILYGGLPKGEVSLINQRNLEHDETHTIIPSLTQASDAAPPEIISLKFDAIDNVLLAGDTNGTLHCVQKNLSPHQYSQLIYAANNPIIDMSLSPVQQHALLLGLSSEPVVVDTPTGKLLGKFSHLGYDVTTLDWHPSRNVIAAGSRTEKCQLWDSRKMESLDIDNKSSKNYTAISLFGHQSSITAVNFHPWKEFLCLSAGRDSVVFLWDIRQTGSPAQMFRIPQELPPKKTRMKKIIETLAAGDDSIYVNRYLEFCSNCSSSVRSKNQSVVKSRTNTFGTRIAWHPKLETIFCVGDSTGCLTSWDLNATEPLTRVDCFMGVRMPREQTNTTFTAQPIRKVFRESLPQTSVTSLQWHPRGSILSAVTHLAAGCAGLIHHWGLRGPNLPPGSVNPDVCEECSGIRTLETEELRSRVIDAMPLLKLGPLS